MYNRREFCQIIGVLAVAQAWPRRVLAAPADSPFAFAHKPAPGGGLVLGTLEDGGNVLLMPSSAGPILIDAKFAHTANDLLSDVTGHFKAPPALLINTHHHADHSGGNWVFSGSARIVAHKNFNPRLTANLPRYAKQAEGHLEELKRQETDSQKIAAAQTVVEKIKSLTAESFAAKDQLGDAETIIDQGDVRLEVRHFGNGHTDNDLVIFLPKQNILHMGDLLFHNLHPFIDRPAKASTQGWQNSLRQAMKLGDDKTVVIPGHGEVTDKTALPKMIEYFDQLREIVTEAMKRGQSKETIAAMKPEIFSGRGLEQLQGQALSAMYDEIAEAMH